MRANDPQAAEDNRRALQEEVDSGGRVRIPPGIFFIKPPILIKGEISISGAAEQTVLVWHGDEPLFRVKGETGSAVTLKHFAAEGSHRTWLVSAASTASFELMDVVVRSAGLITCKSKPREPAQRQGSRRVLGCIGWGRKDSVTAIDFGFVWDAEVSGNLLTGYRHGVTIWGGESNQGKPRFDERQWAAGRIQLTGNVVVGARLGGIWTSRARDVLVSKNIIADCGDVGLDAEGSEDITFSENVVVNCRNGAMTVFFSSNRVRFIKNTIATTNSKWPLFRVYNSSLKAGNHRGVELFDNTFLGLVSEDSPARVDNQNGPISGLQVVNNSFWNTRLDLSFHPAPESVVMGNLFMAGPDAKVSVPFVKFRTDERELVIRKNTFVSNRSAQTASMIQFIGATFPKHPFHVGENAVIGFPQSVMSPEHSNP